MKVLERSQLQKECVLIAVLTINIECMVYEYRLNGWMDVTFYEKRYALYIL